MSDTDGKPAGGGKTLSIADSRADGARVAPAGADPASPDPAGPASAVPALASPGTADSESAASGRQGPRSPDRRNQRRWVPVTAGWLCLLIGLADIVEVVRPGLVYSYRLSRIHQFVPGALINVTHTVSVIIGLLLLMLSHGLKRRKRRAWEAVTLLLAASAVVHVIPFREGRLVTAIISALLVGALLYFRAEFYAV